MSLPRQVIPGSDYMVTRRCSERRFFLRPNDETNNAFVYCLALAAIRARVEVLFVVAMSNHYHAGLHDPDGNFPVFCEHFHALLARCLNAHLGRFENFWSSEPTSAVRLFEGEDVLEKMVYAYANPAAADLVEAIEDWPGVSSFSAALTAGQLTASRPAFFFRSGGSHPGDSLPSAVTVPIARPRAFADYAQEQWSILLTQRVRRAEAEHRDRRVVAGRTVLGREAILAQIPFDCPRTKEPHFGISPRVACKSKWTRIEALQRCKDFLGSYGRAIRAWMQGAADVAFPVGTYWMRRFARVICESVAAEEPAADPIGDSLLPTGAG
jgi:putative transposase